MTRPSRRRVLTAVGAGTAALAGCSAFSSDGGGDEPEIDTDAIARHLRERDGPSIPATTPLSVPADAVTRHREAAREVLSAVPSDLSVPNGAVTRRLQTERSNVADQLDQSAEGSPLERLSTWRDRRGEAVQVSRAYAAATGEADPEAYRERRRGVREALASFETGLTYRAPDPVAATAAYATIESLTDTARGKLEPLSPFPEDPQGAVFEVGDRWEAIETAASGTADARRLRDAYLATIDGTPHRTRLAGAAQRLGYSFRATRDRVGGYVDAEPSVLDADAAEEQPTRELFRQAAGAVDWRGESAASARDRYDYATAVIEAGRGLAAAETLDRVVTEIEAGEYRTEVTEATVLDAHSSAVSAVEDAVAASPQLLTRPLVEPAIGLLDGARRRLDSAGFVPERIQAMFDYAARYARVVPPAATFVADRLPAEADR